ncbi:MAG: acyl carrier protein [Opitutaceae bacterium]
MNPALPHAMNGLPADDPVPSENLKRLPPSASEAARVFRRTGNARYLPTVVRGVLERYVDEEHRDQLKGPRDHLRLAEDLELDSLALMEITLVMEDALGLRIEGDELRRLNTVRDLERALGRKRPMARFG